MENLIITILDVFTILILISFLWGYREVEIVCVRGSWKWKHFKRRWYKFTDQNNVGEKNTDSFHISNGFIFVGIAYWIARSVSIIILWDFWTTLITNIIIYWLFMMYIRNVTMHCIMPKWEKGNPQLKLWFLIPLIGTFIDRKK